MSKKQKSKVVVFESGSGGNMTYVESGGVRVLLDCGAAPVRVRKHLASVGRTPETLDAVFITHEHEDHCRGLKEFLGTRVPIVLSDGTCDAIMNAHPSWFVRKHHIAGPQYLWRHPDIDRDLEAQGFRVRHDAAEPLAWEVCVAGFRVLYVTDCGRLEHSIKDAADDADVLIVEANHDKLMLKHSGRPPQMIHRVRRNHLCNEQAGKLASIALDADAGAVILAHLSEQCNDGALALAMVVRVSENAGADNIHVAPCSIEL